MAEKKVKERKILVPVDSLNPDEKVIHFQHDGVDCFVPVGKVTKVPSWVFDFNPKYAEYEIK